MRRTLTTITLAIYATLPALAPSSVAPMPYVSSSRNANIHEVDIRQYTPEGTFTVDLSDAVQRYTLPDGKVQALAAWAYRIDAPGK